MSLGLTLAKAFEGAAVGALGAAKERDEEVKEAVNKNDALFQQARQYAEKDKAKYDSAVLSSRDRINLADAELGTMIADSSERRLVAANMAKKYTDKTSLQKALTQYQESNKKDGVNVFEGMDLSAVDIESFKGISSEDLAKALVSPSLIPKGFDSYYKPSAFKDESILFGGLGQPQALKAQEEQYASLADASGLNITAFKGEIPVVSLPVAKQPLKIETYANRVERAQAELDAFKKEDVGSEKYLAAEADLEKKVKEFRAFKLAGSTSSGGSGGSIYGSNVQSSINGIISAAEKPRTFYSYSPATLDYYNMNDVSDSYSAAAITSAKKEGSFDYYFSIEDGVDAKSKARERLAADRVAGLTEGELNTALRIRGGSRRATLDSVLGNTISIKQGTSEFDSLPKEQRGLIISLNKGNEEGINRSLSDILSSGFFLTINRDVNGLIIDENYNKVKAKLISDIAKSKAGTP